MEGMVSGSEQIYVEDLAGPTTISEGGNEKMVFVHKGRQ